MSPITKAEAPVAGQGSRFLPATKASRWGYLKATLAYGLACPEVGVGTAVHLDNLARTRAGPRGRAPSPASA